MDSSDYRRRRQYLGTQQEIAERLNVDRGTIVRRETSSAPVSREAELALGALSHARIMKTFYYPAADGSPALGAYGCFLAKGKLVLVLKGDHFSNSDYSRDSALNQILSREFLGIRVDSIRFITVVGSTASFLGQEFEIQTDVDDLEKKANPVQRNGILKRRRRIATVDCITGGCKYVTDFEKAKTLPNAQVHDLVEKAGLSEC